VTRHIPLIVLSSKEEAMIKADAFALGANDYLVKLPDKAELIARIRYHSSAYINLLQRNEAYQAVHDYSLKLEKKNELIRQIFGRYLSDEVVAQILETPEGLQLGGERRKITILTSDLRGFTATSERIPPEEVIKILNFYFGHMADIITKYEGTIDEFMGDGILVLFGAPTVKGDEAARAVACGVEMQLIMETVNQQVHEWGLPPLEMGIGIHTGEVVVGNIGSEKRTKYGIVGSNVNLTYRIESYTTGGQILISEETLKGAGGIVKIESKKEVHPKGVKDPITIYEVGGIAGNYNLFMQKEEEIFFPLPQEIPLQYAIIEGKDVKDTLFLGKIVKISTKGAEVTPKSSEILAIPPPLSNVKINLLDFLTSENGKGSEDIYAKVIEKNSDDRNFFIRFTAKPPQVEAKLNHLYQSLSCTHGKSYS